MERALVVCTIHKGVFFGYSELVDDALIKLVEDEKPIVLRRARMAPYWSTETRSVLGLASIGPQRGSRVSPPSPMIVVESLTLVGLCTEDAARAWESAPWHS